ncbi:MAG TPA: NAD-dependent epimerase/dehydratase family protein [Candidatus Saccharimonadales bacterium]
MKTVLVTGASGFIGRNLIARLTQEQDINILEFTRGNTLEELSELVQKSDFIYHLAAVMRPQSESDFDINATLTEHITTSIKNAGRPIPLLLTSSIQAELDNAYGKSKIEAEKIANNFNRATHNPTYIYRLTNVFGKWAKPNYSSVVATFCYNIAHGLDISIHNPNTTLNLVYIDDVIDEFMKVLQGEPLLEHDGLYYIPRVFTLTLGELAEKIYEIKKMIDTDTASPAQSDDLFDKFLYTTFMSYATT